MATHWVVGDTVLLETTRTAKHYVYALLADDESVFYVGKSCDPATRLRQHVYSGAPEVRAKLSECKLKRMRILAGPVSEAEVGELEKALIREYLAAGVKLVNQEGRPRPTGPVQRHPAILRFAGLEE